MVGNGLGQQGFPTARGTDKKHAFGRYDADLFEQLGLHEREFDGFPYGFHLFIQTCYVFVIDGWLFHHLGPADHRIPCFMEKFHHRKTVLIEGNPRPRFELLRIQSLVERNLEHGSVR